MIGGVLVTSSSHGRPALFGACYTYSFLHLHPFISWGIRRYSSHYFHFSRRIGGRCWKYTESAFFLEGRRSKSREKGPVTPHHDHAHWPSALATPPSRSRIYKPVSRLARHSHPESRRCLDGTWTTQLSSNIRYQNCALKNLLTVSCAIIRVSLPHTQKYI